MKAGDHESAELPSCRGDRSDSLRLRIV